MKKQKSDLKKEMLRQERHDNALAETLKSKLLMSSSLPDFLKNKSGGLDDNGDEGDGGGGREGAEEEKQQKNNNNNSSSSEPRQPPLQRRGSSRIPSSFSPPSSPIAPPAASKSFRKVTTHNTSGNSGGGGASGGDASNNSSNINSRKSKRHGSSGRKRNAEQERHKMTGIALRQASKEFAQKRDQLFSASSANNTSFGSSSFGENGSFTSLIGSDAGFIGQARSRYPLFAETRCAKLLFLVGMELDARETKQREAEEQQRQQPQTQQQHQQQNTNSSSGSKTEKAVTTQNQDATSSTSNAEAASWPLGVLLEHISAVYDFFLDNGAGRAKDLGEFIASAPAQREKLAAALHPATLFESCERYHASDDRVVNFVDFVIGTRSGGSGYLRLLLQATRRVLREQQTGAHNQTHHVPFHNPRRAAMDCDPDAPTRVGVNAAIAVSESMFDFSPAALESLREDLLRNCVPRLGSTDVQLLLAAPDFAGKSVQAALADRFVPLHLAQTIWRELVNDNSVRLRDQAADERALRK